MAIPTGIQEKIDNTALAAAAAAVPGAFLPIVDIAAMSGLWIKLLNDIGKDLGHVDREGASKKFVLSLFTGAGFYFLGSRLFGMLISWTGIGAVGTVSLNAALNYIYTQRLGKYVYDVYSRPGFKFSDFAKVSIAGLVFGSVGADQLASIAELLNNGSHIAETATTVADVSGMLETSGHVAETLHHSHSLVEASGTAGEVFFGGPQHLLETAMNTIQHASAEKLPSYLAKALEFAHNNPVEPGIVNSLEKALRSGAEPESREALKSLVKAISPGKLKTVLSLIGPRFSGSSV